MIFWFRVLQRKQDGIGGRRKRTRVKKVGGEKVVLLKTCHQTKNYELRVSEFLGSYVIMWCGACIYRQKKRERLRFQDFD